MNDLSAHLRVIMRAALFFFAACLLIWAFVVEIRPQVAGLMLGTAFSLFNAYLLSTKIQQIARAVTEVKGKRVSTGFLSRICTVLIAVMISIKLPQFDLLFTIIGLFLAQMATLLMGIFSAFKK